MILPTFERKWFGSGPVAFVRQFAVAQEIALEVADREIVLHYALALLDEAGLIGTDSLLFKGGTIRSASSSTSDAFAHRRRVPRARQ